MKLLSKAIMAVVLTMAPAMAQSLSGRVAVGPIGSAMRSWASVPEAQKLCQRGCWITDGIEVTQGNWVPNTLFPGARPFREHGTGHGLLEVRPSR